MKNIRFMSGKNIYDFFVIPTIRFNYDGWFKYLTFEWLAWFVGFKWYKTEE